MLLATVRMPASCELVLVKGTTARATPPGGTDQIAVADDRVRARHRQRDGPGLAASLAK